MVLACFGVQSERRFELSLLGVVDLQSNTAYALDAQQTLDEKDKTVLTLTLNKF